MNLIDAKIQHYSKARYLHIMSIWWLLIKLNFCTLTAWCQTVEPCAGDWEDVFIFLSVKCRDQINFLSWNHFLMRGYSSLWIHRCCTMQPLCYPSGKNHFRLELKYFGTFYCTSIILKYCSEQMKLINLPCIQNRRNPGLLCHPWSHLWNQVGDPEGAQRNLCSLAAPGLHGAPWSLGHGNPLFHDCAWGGFRTSRNSFSSPQPRLAFDPWHE